MTKKWWFRSLGQDFGPLRFADLVEAARRGMLAPGDMVRQSELGTWRKADSINNLFPTNPQSEPIDALWIVEVVGQELTPMSLAEVAGMIRARKLLPTDRVRHFESQQWHSIGLILDRRSAPKQTELPDTTTSGNDRSGVYDFIAVPQASLTTQQKRQPSIDDNELERLILSVLGAPDENYSKPSLAELGLAVQLLVDCPQTECHPAESDSLAVTEVNPPLTTKGTRWSLNPFLRAGLPSVVRSLGSTLVQPADGSSDFDYSILTKRERSYLLRDSNPETVGASVSLPKRFPWLESLIGFSWAALLFQIFPGAWSSAITYFDIRGWTFQNWVVAQIVVIVILTGVAIRQRRLSG